MFESAPRGLTTSLETLRCLGPWGYLTASVAVASLILLPTFYNLFFHPLRKVPGPLLARFSQSWRNHKYFRGTWHDDAIELHRKYGNVVRIAPDEVSFVDAAALKALYGHGQKVVKSKWYDTWIVPNMTVSFFAATDIKQHRHLRSRVSGAYSMTAILSMEPLIQDVARDMWRKMGEFADEGTPVPMHDWANFFAFDVVGTLAMGGPIGFIERGIDVDGIIRSIHDGFWMMANMGNMPLQMFWFNNPVVQWALKNFGGKRLAAFSLFLNWLDNRVEERYRNGLGDKRRDLLQLFIDAKDISGNPVKKGDVMIEGVNILGAGADTTTIGILATLGAILHRPHAARRLQAELDEAYERLGIDGVLDDIPYTELAKLPYLSAIIKESTRLHPSIQYQLPRVVPKGGVMVGPHQVPEGMICSISPTTMNRSKEIFGPDADEWNPQRWIPERVDDEERIKIWTSQLTTASRSPPLPNSPPNG
ncbi:related to pisatin demethylase / cytochrome P450 monooxygenase [Cephalotrichum gorgonifer]|uniref:Related to pisatin demethylase / cytochrome P450 monooxygenase n=1 Tax=Cephalotrichum gorgonifer TaxID=2041049 RepID=A0AAE8N7P7_9PEZI|nr:related to pisatin demethylase / cytochrome P450 monooxygenase [Cephalotrichum gorgonifer]